MKLALLISNFSIPAGAALLLQLPSFVAISTTVLDAKGNVVGEMEVLKFKPVDASVFL